MPIKIYKSDFSPPVRAVLMITEFLKLKHETQEVNLAIGEHKKEEYLEKNPLGLIPLLEDGDLLLSDSHAIITYLVSKYGAEKRAELYPNDLALRATVNQRLFFDATVLFAALKGIGKAIIFEKATGPSEKSIAEVNEGYAVLEKYLEKTKFVACDYLTLADVSLVASVSSLEKVVPIDEKYEKIHAWFGRLQEQEWYQTINVPGLVQYMSFFDSFIERNKKN